MKLNSNLLFGYFILISSFISLTFGSCKSKSNKTKGSHAKDFITGGKGGLHPDMAMPDSDYITVRTDGKVMKTHIGGGGSEITNEEIGKVVKKTTENRIIGGSDTSVKTFPYQVMIKFGDDKELIHCGGAIYNVNYIITAAHCFVENHAFLSWDDMFGMEFTAGSTSISIDESTEQKRTMDHIKFHDSFNPAEPQFYDFAIVKMNRPFHYNEYVQPIPVGNAAATYQKAVISGWGYTLPLTKLEKPNYNLFPDILRYVKIDIFSDQTCRQYFSTSNAYLKMFNTVKVVCAGTDNGSKDSCYGDSGGPLACFDRSGSRVLCGIASLGWGCGQRQKPGIYVSIANYMDVVQGFAGYGDQRTFPDVPV